MLCSVLTRVGHLKIEVKLKIMARRYLLVYDNERTAYMYIRMYYYTYIARTNIDRNQAIKYSAIFPVQDRGKQTT